MAAMHTGTNTGVKLETEVTYQVGKMTFSVGRVFQSDNAKTLPEILVKLIKKEAQNP